MTDSNIEVDTGAWFIGVALLVIAFWGEPDVIDALIHFLMNCAGCG